MHISFEYRGRRVAVTKDGFGWHVQAHGRVVSRRVLVDAFEVALPDLSQREQDKLTAVLLKRAARDAHTLTR